MAGLNSGHVHKHLTPDGEPHRYIWECKRRKNVNDKECIPLVSVSKGCTFIYSFFFFFFKVQNDVHMNKILREESPSVIVVESSE